MAGYSKELPLNKAYKLINHGPLMLVLTSSKSGKYNIAPVAWNCPAECDPTRVLIVLDKKHKTYKNIAETGEFAVCVPVAGQLELVEKTGSVSGTDVDKYKKFKIDAVPGTIVKVRIPAGCVGYIECRVYKLIDEGETGIVIGEAVKAFADEDAYNNMLTGKSRAGKTLHHFGGNDFGIVIKKGSKKNK